MATLGDTVEKSIGYFERGNGASSLVVQRFHQNVNHPVHSGPDKGSFLARLQLSIPKRIKSVSWGFDGPVAGELRESSMAEHPKPSHASSSHHVPFAIPVSEDSRAGQQVHGDESVGRPYDEPERLSRPLVIFKTRGIPTRQSSAPISLSPVQRKAATMLEHRSAAPPAEDVADLIRPTGDTTRIHADRTPVPLPLPNKLGRAVKSRLGRLVPAFPFPVTHASNPSQRRRKAADPTARSATFPEHQVYTAWHGYPQHMGHGIQKSKASRRLSYPLTLQTTGFNRSSVGLSPRMAALLDGASEFGQDSPSTSALSLAAPINPTGDTTHWKESTATNNKFVTPLSSMYPSNNSSFHSYPQSTAESRAMLAVVVRLAEEPAKSNDADSVESDTTLFKRLRSRLFPALDSAPVARARFKTWGATSRTRPALDLDSLGEGSVGKRKAGYVV